MRSLVLSLFNTNKNKKVVKTRIYLPRVVYTAQTKARQALGKSRKFVKTQSGLHNADESQNKQLLGENSDHLDNMFKEQARRRHLGKEDIKNKESSSKKKYNILLQRLEYKGQLH